MWRSVPLTALGALALAWVRAVVRRDAELASPAGPPIAHASGPDPDRILVLGSPIVQGIGVASYDLSFGGHLARKLAHRTRRGADVETRGIDKFDALNAAETLRAENLDRFDAVLILGGVTEIVQLMALGKYRATLETLFDTIREHAPHSLPVLIAGVAPFLQDMNAPRFAVRWMERRIARQNEATRLACIESGVAEYVEFQPERAGVRLGRDASVVYESWATALVPAVDAALAGGLPKRELDSDEGARQRAFEALGVDEGDAAVDRIVEMAREMLGVDSASLNLVDGERMLAVATNGIDLHELPREQTICNVTIRRPGMHVVEDVESDPDFRDAPWRREFSDVRFYAGYPLEAPGGERIGALCVLDHTPRHFSASEEATLRDLALAAQAALWQKIA